MEKSSFISNQYFTTEDKIEVAIPIASNMLVSSALNLRNSSLIVFELSTKRTPIESFLTP